MELKLKQAEISIPQAIENLEQLKAEIAPKMEEYRSLVVTENGIKAAKADKANLNKFKKVIDDQRIAVKKQCLAPYEAFEKECKELEALIIAPIAAIDTQIKAFEDAEKNKKYAELQAYFESVNNVEFLKLDDILNQKWGNKTLSINTLKEEISANISRISGEYEQIRRMYQDSPLLTPIVNKFIEKKELSPTLVYASQLESDLTREQRRKAEMEARQRENAENAVICSDNSSSEIIQENVQTAVNVEYGVNQSSDIIMGTFRVTCTEQQLISLRDFMKTNKIKYEVVKG